MSVALTFMMSMFHKNVQEIEWERNSVLEVLDVLESVCQILELKLEEGFLCFKTQWMY
jgi:hypothetical protein